VAFQSRNTTPQTPIRNPKNPRRHKSDRKSKEENQKLEAGKIICRYTPEPFLHPEKDEKNHFSILKRTRKNHFSIPKRTRKHHPFTSKVPAKLEEKKKFIDKRNYHKSLGLPSSMNTLKRGFCLQGKNRLRKISTSVLSVKLSCIRYPYGIS
jgi:hypothetical protein